MKAEGGANEEGFRMYEMLKEKGVLDAIAELGSVIVIFEDVKSHVKLEADGLTKLHVEFGYGLI